MKRLLRLLVLCAGLCLLLVVGVGAADFTSGSAVLHVDLGDSSSSISGPNIGISFSSSSQTSNQGSWHYASFKDITYSFSGGPSNPLTANTVITLNGRFPYFYPGNSYRTYTGSTVPSSIKVYLTDYLSSTEYLAYTLKATDYGLTKVTTSNINFYSCNIFCSFSVPKTSFASVRIVYQYPSLTCSGSSGSLVLSMINDGTFKVSAGEASASDAINDAADAIINSLGKDIQLSNNELVNIRQYAASLYSFFTTAHTDPDGTSYAYNWNDYTSSVIKFFAAFQSQNLTTHTILSAINNAIDNLQMGLGYNPLFQPPDPGWETLKDSLKTMNVAIVAAINNGVTDIIDHMESSYGDVDTGQMSGTTSDTNTIISNSDQVEGNLMQSATAAMGDINLDTINIGSQTIAAMVALLPFYDGFFTASGEVGLVLVFSLAVGIILLLIGRRGQAAITRISRNRGDEE